MLTRKNYFGVSSITFFLTYVIFGLFDFNFLDSFRNTYEDSFVDPFSYIILSSFLTSLTLLFFTNAIFKLWLQKIVVWFLPFSVIVLAVSSPSRSGAVSFSRTDYAIALGVLLVVITLVFALIQKFYYKR